MSATALFTPGEGSFFTPHSEKINALPPSRRVAASEVWHTVLDRLRRGQTQTDERITDLVLAQLLGRSRRFVQKGLKALQDLGLIERRRRHGRRIIIVLERLRGSDKPRPRARAETKPAAGKPASIPNVGIIPPTPPELIAAAAAAQAERECPEPTPEEIAAAERFLEESRQRREQARRAEEARQGRGRSRRSGLRPVLVNAPAPISDVPDDAPGRSAQAILDARRQAMGIRVVPGTGPAPAPDADPGTAPPPDGP